MAGNFDFLHVKRNTAGSSNELSLDVLDHKRDEADARENRSNKPFITTRPSESYHGVTDASPLSSQAEVRQRKEARQSRRIHGRIVAALVITAVVVAGAFVVTTFLGHKADNTLQIDRLVNRITAVDEALADADALMEDPLNEDNEKDREKIISQMPQEKTELNRISVELDSLTSFPLDSSEKVLVGQLKEAVDARKDMLASIEGAFKMSKDAEARVKEANQVWSSVLDADQLARESISEANRATTPETTSQSLAKAREALSGFTDALTRLKNIAKECGADLSEQIAYLEKKVEALEYAVKTSEALLAGDREGAMTQNEAYNEADDQAANLAEGLQPSIGGLVRERYEETVQDYQESYEDARAHAVQADAVIREYVAQ